MKVMYAEVHELSKILRPTTKQVTYW